MKIGNGCLEIGIFAREGEFLMQELRKLVEDTLNIYPLGNIFHLGDIRGIKIPSVQEVCRLFDMSILSKIKSSKKDSDILALIKRKGVSRCYETGILESEADPIIFGHELGHALGLSDSKCCQFYEDDYPKEELPHAGYTMCYDSKRFGGRKGFSPEDIEKLERWFLK